MLHAFAVPSSNPRWNQRVRCSEEPCVHVSGFASPRLALEAVVADDGGGPEPFLQIARLEEVLVVGGMRPDARETVGLQLEPD